MTDGDDLQQIDGDADDPRSLLGAYVLDALDDDERGRVEAYLAADPAARAEVDRLARSFDVVVSEGVAPVAPPSELWDRIATNLPPRPERTPGEPTADTAPPVGSGTDELADRREAKRRRTGSNTTRIVLSVAAAVIVVLVGLAIVRQSSTKTTSVAQQIQRDAEAAANAPDSKTTTLTGPTVRSRNRATSSAMARSAASPASRRRPPLDVIGVEFMLSGSCRPSESRTVAPTSGSVT